MNINEYKEIRKVGMTLGGKVLDFEKNSSKEMIEAGTLLGFWTGSSFCFDSEEDSSTLMDYLMYEPNRSGSRLIDRFYDSDIELSDLEEDILEGQVNHFSSVFEVVGADSSTCMLTLADLLDGKSTEYELMDLGMSQTCKLGLVIFTRLIPIRGIHMTSGVSFAFHPETKSRLLGEIAFEKLKKRGRFSRTDLFVFANRKGRQYGAESRTVETSL